MASFEQTKVAPAKDKSDAVSTKLIEAANSTQNTTDASTSSSAIDAKQPARDSSLPSLNITDQSSPHKTSDQHKKVGFLADNGYIDLNEMVLHEGGQESWQTPLQGC